MRGPSLPSSASCFRSLVAFFSGMLLAGAMVVLPGLAAAQVLESPRGFSLRYPDSWSEAAPRFRDAHELIRVPAESLGTPQALEAARIMVTTESRTGHAEAVQRLKEIEAEQNGAAEFLVIGGWPALQRSYLAPVSKPGPAEERPEEPELALRVTSAIAAGALLLRIEGYLPPGTDEAQAGEIEAIGRSATFSERSDPAQVADEIESLRSSPRLSTPQASGGAPAGLDGFPLTVEGSGAESASSSSPGVVQRVQTGSGVDSEVEIVVSNDGQNIIVANNSRDYATSNDGGLTFATTGVAPTPPGGQANGDPSLAFGASGSFYFAYIGFPATGQCSTGITSSTDNGQNFNFVANATVCDNAGVAGATCFPDQEHIAADRSNLSASNQDQVYSTWRNFSGGGCGGTLAIAGPEIPSLVCSSNSGQNWGTTVAVGNMNEAYPRITVAQDGFVYVVYRAGNNIMLNKFSSCDNGLNQQMGFPKTVAAGISRVTCGVTTAIPGLDRCNSGSDLSSQMVAVDDTDPNHVYVAYAISTRAGVNENVVVQDSTDGGVTWPGTRKVRLNNLVNGRRFMPWVCTTNGTAFVSWYDMRNATAAQNDLADYFGGSAFRDGMGNLQAGAEFRISTVSDPLCASGWPIAPRGQGDSERCSVQPQLAGVCTNAIGMSTGVRCDFSDCGGAGMGVGAACQCNTAANETCNLGRGIPKYGDYNGNACRNGQLFAAWASATSPPVIQPPSSDIDVFFDTPFKGNRPRADAGPDQNAEWAIGGVQVTLDGKFSSDVDADPLILTWTGDFAEGGGTVTGVLANVTFTSLGVHAVELEVHDSVGFSDTDNVVITVEDTTAPSLTAPAGVTLECTSPQGAPAVLGSPIASDTCDPSVDVSNDAPATLPFDAMFVTWTATDDSGNSASATQAVSVVDTTPPAITPPADLSAECTSPDGASPAIGTATASDVCDAAPAVSSDAPGVFPIGSTPVTWTATDDFGNSASGTQAVGVVDTTPPAITPPPDASAECTSPVGTPVSIGTATASDVCDPLVDLANDAPALFPVGSTPVTWTAMDDKLNTSSDVQLVTVTDTLAPLVEVTVSPSVIRTRNHKLVTITASVATSEDCDASPTVRLVSITSNEPVEDGGDGSTESDIQDALFGTDDREFRLRAERRGAGGGRAYTIVYEVEDASGNVGRGEATVLVARSGSKKS